VKVQNVQERVNDGFHGNYGEIAQLENCCVRIVTKRQCKMKKVCRCGKVFVSDGYLCESCKKYQVYLCVHPQPIKKKIIVLPELRFFFHTTYVTEIFDKDGYDLSASFEQNSKDKEKFSIHIYLFKYNTTDGDTIKKICNSISHEYLHMAITIYSGDFEASKKLDESGLMNRLSQGGYL